MNRVFLHSKNDESKNIQHFYFLLLIFVLFGLYKNGFLLYKNNLISLIELFKPFYLCIISLIISFVFSLIKKEKLLSYRLISNILVSLIVPFNVSYLIYSILLLVLNVIYCFVKYNLPAFYMVVLSIISLVMNNYTYLNAYEASHTLKYDLLDYLFGKGIGGISNTFLLLTLILGIVYICNKTYKKHIVISFLIANFIFNIISVLITKDLTISQFINNNILFAAIFIAPISINSPYTRGGCYLYGVILAIICFGFSFWNLDFGLYIGICLLSMLSKILDRPFIR